MQAVGNVTQNHKLLASERKTRQYNLSFYSEPPQTDVEINNFEQFAISRLQVLRRIDVLRARGISLDKVEGEVMKADKKHFGRGSEEKDLISHYVLRMAFCRKEELRRWFLTNECQLFALRIKHSRPHEVDEFLEENSLGYEPIPHSEKERLRTQLTALTGTLGTDYYRVPFTQVPSLVASREVFMELGFAYVNRDKISSLIEGKFRSCLSKSLTLASVAHRDDRVGPILQGLSRVGFRYGFDENSTSRQNDAETVKSIFSDYLTATMGHSDLKFKPVGVSKMFISTGTRRPNERDRTCPIAGRVHKSNTQKYTIYFDTGVMMQGCWDGACQAEHRNIYYQIREGKCVHCGWDPPNPELATAVKAEPSGKSQPVTP
mmetsp:Transcript_32956/g.49765  ORF Transcript_32956/g.49765 Transcript_32956/m.49765 type:complete len:376 (-) Transcript_32956:1305-2432(-)|eukprot:CAMPEP_0178920878 /NCGR_PEP_ID=MMETSP0786-20121207/15247_1 /TAXON_ID=186022 /ORGANISM="Thalassionema frauenfeldii, Strain CCMP 1798" /LENGTH=375 /DNA_ID=CAMNT_0020594989 /DNA_START=106 /DNA_END=1233 /DNA_ORIENTATION=+